MTWLGSLDPIIAGIIGGTIVLAIIIIEVARLEARKFRRRLESLIDEVDKQVDLGPTVEPLVPEFDTVDEIHAYYAKLSETDPIEAGKAKYRAQLKLHGA